MECNELPILNFAFECVQFEKKISSSGCTIIALASHP